MPKSGTPLSVRMTNCGSLGWVTDESGYRYEGCHPETGHRWPSIPPILIEIWERLARYPHAPEACLVNYYGPAARMGLHRIATSRTSRHLWFRCRLGIDAYLGSAASTGPIRPAQFGSLPVMRWCLPDKRGSLFMVSTGSSPARPRCCRKAAGSMLRYAASTTP